MLRPCALLLAVAAVASWFGSPAVDDAAARAHSGLRTGLTDGLFQSDSGSERSLWLDRAADSGSEVVLLVATWRSIAPADPSPAFDPTNHLDPGYAWGSLDGAVVDAQAAGRDPMIIVNRAPAWAEGPGRAGGAASGTWLPDPGELRKFGHAIADRYSGVKYFQLWAEPNLSNYLAPQWESGAPTGARHYRKMLRNFSEGIKESDPENKVVTGGTAPYGDEPGGQRTRPLAFWREVFCLEGRRELKPRKCPRPPKLDVLAHHPINTSGGPHGSAFDPDDASTSDFDQVVRILRKAEKVGNLKGGHHPAWATEIWWETDPPDGFQGVPPGVQARWLEDALYVLWKQGARVVINFQIRDGEFDPQNAFVRNVTGLYFLNGDPKPALRAWTFPFVTHRMTKSKVRGWGKAPATGQMRLQVSERNGWRTVKDFPVQEGDVFHRALRIKGRERLRAQVADINSLVWTQDH